MASWIVRRFCIGEVATKMLQMEAARKTPSMNSLRLGINCRLSPANTYLDQTSPCHWTRLIKLSKSHWRGGP